jgi:hypothetical protein
MAKRLNIQVIRQAQAGNMQSMTAVAEQVRPKVYTYIYRLTLDYHLTQDLTQLPSPRVGVSLYLNFRIRQFYLPLFSFFWFVPGFVEVDQVFP